MKYIFKKQVQAPETSKFPAFEEIEVQPERWVWGVIYKDDTELHQFGDDGIFHQIGEVKQDQIKMAVLYRYGGPLERRIDIPWRDGMKLIHKYRNIVLNAGNLQEKRIKIYIFGYKYGDQYNLNYVLPDDRMVQSPKDDVELILFGI